MAICYHSHVLVRAVPLSACPLEVGPLIPASPTCRLLALVDNKDVTAPPFIHARISMKGSIIFTTSNIQNNSIYEDYAGIIGDALAYYCKTGVLRGTGVTIERLFNGFQKPGSSSIYNRIISRGSVWCFSLDVRRSLLLLVARPQIAL
jgi:hypothetical protein